MDKRPRRVTALLVKALGGGTEALYQAAGYRDEEWDEDKIRKFVADLLEGEEVAIQELNDAITHAYENNLDEVRLPLDTADILNILAEKGKRKGLHRRGTRKGPEHKLTLKRQAEEWQKLRDVYKSQKKRNPAQKAYDDLNFTVGLRQLQRVLKEGS
jgi:hypothetical protein